MNPTLFKDDQKFGDKSSQSTPAWLEEIGDLPDHYHGHVWSNGVMPNNFLFFLRQEAGQLQPNGVSHTLHRRYEFVVNYSGAGRVCLGDRIFEFRPSEGFLVQPGTFHYYFGTPQSDFQWLFFTFELKEATLLKGVREEPYRLTKEGLKEIERAAKLYLNPRSEGEVFEAGLAMGRVLQSLAGGAASPVLSDPSQSEIERCSLLRRVSEFVDENMESAVRIDDIAKDLEMSESNLRKVFREHFGVSLGNYLRFSRLTRGVQLIDKSELPVSTIAQRCGFESIFSFSQSFSRSIGMSPSAYRKHLENGNPPIRLPLHT